MQKKGQAELQIGMIIGIFVLVIVGVALFTATASEVSKSTSSQVYNETNSELITVPVNNSVIDLEGQELLSTPIVYNLTDGAIIGQVGNYTIDEGISTTTGLKTIRYNNTGGGVADYAGKQMNISYTYGPDGYITDGGGRAVANLILIFFALAIAVVALVPTLRNGIIDVVSS